MRIFVLLSSSLFLLIAAAASIPTPVGACSLFDPCEDIEQTIVGVISEDLSGAQEVLGEDFSLSYNGYGMPAEVVFDGFAIEVIR